MPRAGPPPRAPHPWTGTSALCLRQSDGRHRAGMPLHPRGLVTHCEHMPSRHCSLLCRDPQPPASLLRSAQEPPPCRAPVDQAVCFRKGLAGRWQPRGREQAARGSHFFFSRRSFSAWVPSLAGTRGSCTPSSESVSRTGRGEMACQLDPLLLLPWPGPGLGSRPRRPRSLRGPLLGIPAPRWSQRDLEWVAPAQSCRRSLSLGCFQLVE